MPELGSCKALCKQAVFAWTVWINLAMKVLTEHCAMALETEPHGYRHILNLLRARVRSIRTFRPKTSCCQLPYQRHSSSADCTRKLFKGSNGSASPVVCTRKNFFCLGLTDFCEWRHKWSIFWAILAHVTWPRAQLLGQSVSLKFSLETRLESESFEPLIDFLAFPVQTLWSKIKLIN